MISVRDFTSLCVDASRHLSLDDLHGLGAARPVDIDGMLTVLSFDTATCARAYLSLPLGPVDQDQKIQVYESLLTLQGSLHGNLDCAFIYDGPDDDLNFRVLLPVSDETTGEGLAVILKMFVQQVKDWRTHILNGDSSGLNQDKRPNLASFQRTSINTLA